MSKLKASNLSLKELTYIAKLSNESDIDILEALEKAGYEIDERYIENMARSSGLPFFNADDFKLDGSLLELMPLDFCQSQKVIPIKKDGDVFFVGMVNANNIFVFDLIQEKLANLKVARCWILKKFWEISLAHFEHNRQS